MSYKLPEENEEKRSERVKKERYILFFQLGKARWNGIFIPFCLLLLLYKDGDHWNEKKKLGGNYVESMLEIQYNVQRSSSALKITSNKDLHKKCKVWCRIRFAKFLLL